MIRDRAASEIRRTRIVLRVATSTGLARTFTARGLGAAALALLEGGANPALIYRIYAADRGAAPAIIDEDGVIDFATLWERIRRFAGALERRGVGRGDTVLVTLKNRVEFVVAQNAAALVGGAAVTASFHATTSELEYLASHARARVAVVEAERAHDLRRILGPSGTVVTVTARGAAPHPDARALRMSELWLEPPPMRRRGARSMDPAVVVYTSGTTGAPKGAVRKFPRDTLPSALSFIAETPMSAGDVHLVLAPLYHSTAYAFATMTHLLGGAIVLRTSFEPARFYDDVAAYRVNTTALVPTMLHRLLAEDDRRSFPHLRAIFSGGAALSPALAARARERFGDVLFNFYGATETGLVTLATPEDLRRAPGTIGRAVPGVEVRVLDERGVEAPPGVVGELYARSPLLSAGYLRDASATAGATRDGFMSVGDLARRDDEGRFFLEGRRREMIISGGVNVYPIEVEHALESHPDVVEAAVIGMPDEEWGERVRAYVVRRDGAALDAEGLRAFMKTKVDVAKVPREIVFIEALPRNPTGKVQKARLPR